MRNRVKFFIMLFLLVLWNPFLDAAEDPDVENGFTFIFQGRVVTYNDQEPVNNAVVWVKNPDTRKETPVSTNDDGEYILENIEPGVYFVCVQKGGYYAPYHHVLIHKSMSYRVNNRTRKCVLDFSLVQKEDEPKLTGVVYDDDGYHIDKTEVRLEGFDRRYRTDEYGTYVIRDIPETLKTLIVEKDGFVTREFYILAPRSLSETNSGKYERNMKDHQDKSPRFGYSKLNPDFSRETFNIEVMRLSRPVSVGPAGWVDKRFGGTEITFPPGALKTVEDIRITRIPTEFIELNEDRVPVPNPAVRFDFRPRGLRFEKPVRVVTKALIPEQYALDKNAQGELAVLNERTGKIERIKAVYDHEAHTVTYALSHFSRIIPDNSIAGRFKETARRTETVKKSNMYARCVPRGCVNCIEFGYYTDWGIENQLSADLDFTSVMLEGRIIHSVGGCAVCRSNKEIFTKLCDAAGCRYVNLIAGASGVFDIAAYHLTPWFSAPDGFHAYVVRMINENDVSQCVPGDPCGDGLKCADDPSECCRKVCDQGRCAKYVSNGAMVECRKCGPAGRCIPDNSMPCSDGDPCTVRDRCVGGRCVGVRPASLKDPDCLKKPYGDRDDEMNRDTPGKPVYKPY